MKEIQLNQTLCFRNHLEGGMIEKEAARATRGLLGLLWIAQPFPFSGTDIPALTSEDSYKAQKSQINPCDKQATKDNPVSNSQDMNINKTYPDELPVAFWQESKTTFFYIRHHMYANCNL